MTKTHKGTAAQPNNGSLNNDEEKKTTKAYHTLVICLDYDETNKIMLNDYRIFNDQGFNVSLNKDHKLIIINDGNTSYNRFYESVNDLTDFYFDLFGGYSDNIEVRFYRPRRQDINKLIESLKRIKSYYLNL